MIEVIVNTFLKIIIRLLFYWTGFLLLKIVSLGRIRLSPIGTLGQKNKNRTQKPSTTWSIWLVRPYKPRSLKAELVLLTGVLVWFSIGVTIYFTTQN